MPQQQPQTQQRRQPRSQNNRPRQAPPKHKKIFAFIDSQNLNLGIRSSGWSLDFQKFRRLLKEKYHVEKAFLFIGHVTGNEELYTYLRESGYEVIYKPTLEFKRKEERITKGNVDAELVMHTMIQWPNFEECIIVSGDGDFFCIIEHLEKNQKLHKILVPSQKYSSLLKPFAQKIIYVGLFRKKVEKKEG